MKASHWCWCSFYFKKPMTFENLYNQSLSVPSGNLKKRLQAIESFIIVYNIVYIVWLSTESVLRLVVAMASTMQHNLFLLSYRASLERERLLSWEGFQVNLYFPTNYVGRYFIKLNGPKKKCIPLSVLKVIS